MDLLPPRSDDSPVVSELAEKSAAELYSDAMRDVGSAHWEALIEFLMHRVEGKAYAGDDTRELLFILNELAGERERSERAFEEYKKLIKAALGRHERHRHEIGAEEPGDLKRSVKG